MRPMSTTQELQRGDTHASPGRECRRAEKERNGSWFLANSWAERPIHDVSDLSVPKRRFGKGVILALSTQPLKSTHPAHLSPTAATFTRFQNRPLLNAGRFFLEKPPKIDILSRLCALSVIYECLKSFSLSLIGGVTPDYGDRQKAHDSVGSLQSLCGKGGNEAGASEGIFRRTL